MRGKGVTVADRWSWVAGLVGSVVVLAPAFRGGSLLNFDLVLTPRIPVPSGVWGLGPDIPRRMPLGLLLAWASTVVGGRVAGLVLFLACLTVAFAGAAHLARGCSLPFRLLAGVLFAFNPFTLTRLTAGHWTVLAAEAVLPWAMPTLLRPASNLRATFLWCAAFGATGFVGGAFAACLLAVGLVADRGSRAIPIVLRWAVAQIPWAVPGVIVIAAAPHIATAASFPTRGEGLLGPLGSALAGHGFWQPSQQVGGQAAAGIVVLGVLFLVLGIYGWAALPAAWAKRAAAAGALGLIIAIASGTPGLRSLYGPLSSTPLLEAFRESQKGLALYLAWLAPAAAFGASRLAETATTAVTAAKARVGRAVYAGLALACALALALGGSGLSGLYGRLEPVQFPAGWRQARALIQSEPGTTLALPWHQYLAVSWARNRLLLNPLPDFLGGDVISSSDPGFAGANLERADPREPLVADLINDLTPDGVGPVVQALDVRWVVLAHEVDWQEYGELDGSAALEAVVRSPELTLYRVKGWVAPLTSDGRAVSDHAVVRPLLRAGKSGRAVLAQPFAGGWLRGLHFAWRTQAGLIALPSGGSVVWYWPALIVVLTELGWIVVVFRASLTAVKERTNRSLTSAPATD